MKNITTATADQWGAQLETAARAIAELLAFVYCCGYCCGELIHRLNDQLAGIEPPAAPPAPIVHPLAAVADDLQQLTVRELRQLTGVKRGRKADLINALVAA